MLSKRDTYYDTSSTKWGLAGRLEYRSSIYVKKLYVHHFLFVVSTPLKVLLNWDDYSKIRKNRKCSKPPSRLCYKFPCVWCYGAMASLQILLPSSFQKVAIARRSCTIFSSRYSRIKKTPTIEWSSNTPSVWPWLKPILFGYQQTMSYNSQTIQTA